MRVVDRHGWLILASASSRTEHPSDEHDARSCRGCRWFEVRLSRRPKLEPDDDDEIEYRIEMVGRTRVEGEVDRIRVEYTTSPGAIVDYLTMGEPGRRYIPKVSRKVLHEAGDIDETIGDALDYFDEINGAAG
jgi:hypothetical protein